MEEQRLPSCYQYIQPPAHTDFLHTQHKTLVHGPKHRHCWYEDRHLSGRRWYQGSSVLGFCGVLECLDRAFDNQFKCIVELMGRSEKPTEAGSEGWVCTQKQKWAYLSGSLQPPNAQGSSNQPCACGEWVKLGLVPGQVGWETLLLHGSLGEGRFEVRPCWSVGGSYISHLLVNTPVLLPHAVISVLRSEKLVRKFTRN